MGPVTPAFQRTKVVPRWPLWWSGHFSPPLAAQAIHLLSSANALGAGVVGEGVGEVFGPVHLTGGLHGPELRQTGHIAPSVHPGFGERTHPAFWKLFPTILQIPLPTPVKLLPSKNLYFTQHEGEGGVYTYSTVRITAAFESTI